MRGAYKYAQVRMALVKLVQRDKKGNQDFVFIDGVESLGESNQCILKLDELSGGSYVLIYDIEWTNLHMNRNAVLNTYANDKSSVIKQMDHK